MFDSNGFFEPVLNQLIDRFQYGGEASAYTKVAFINLREIRNIKFGTRGPLMYHDIF